MTQRTKARKIKAPCSSIVNNEAVWFISYLFRHTQLRIFYAQIITVGKIIPSNLHLEHVIHLWPILLLLQQKYRAQQSY
jgi:hypothetical protein